MMKFKQGDIILMENLSLPGNKQILCCPVLVVSNNDYNGFCSQLIVCPIAKTESRFPFHIELDTRTSIRGTVMCEHICTVPMSYANTSFKERVPTEVLEEVCDTLRGFMDVF